MLLAIAALIVDAATGSDFGVMMDGAPIGSGLATLILSIVMLVPTLSVQFRRLHDTGRTAWWMFIGAVPIVGVFILLYFLAQRGEAVTNRFGAALNGSQQPSTQGTPTAYQTPSPTSYQVGAAIPTSPPVFEPQAPIGGSVIEALERLARLRDSGVLTHQEFEAQKSQLLRR